MTPFHPRGRGILAACGALLLCAAPALADDLDAAEGAAREQRPWMETVAAGGTVRVVNPHGNVYARFGGYGDQVELLATIQRLESELPPLDVAFDRSENTLEIRVEASSEGQPLETRDRIDLVLFVPIGQRFDVHTEDGLIEAKGLKGDVTLSSITGDVRIKEVEGLVRAKTSRGSIAATLASGATGEPQSLVTETGEIEVYLWEDAHMDVRIETSGRITTDFSLDVEHLRFEEPGKRAVASVGKGGARLRLTSKRGDIRLLRLQKNFKPEP